MARLRKTLPEDFKEIVASGDVEKIKAALLKCVPDAVYSRYDQRTALMHPELPEEVVRWLVNEYGADINYADQYGRTALSEASIRRPEKIGLLLSLGADINFQRAHCPTALIYAAMSYRVQGVRLLIENGADVRLTGGYSGFNALEEALIRCQNADIPAMALLARSLIDAGIEITGSMRTQVAHLGENFEFYRDGFAEDYLPACDAGLAQLYKLFDVPPVPHRKKYDGSAPISVSGGTWTEQYEELWDMLVPCSGKAPFVQGEAIRLIGRLSHEILDNGGCNWDDDFRAMRDGLAKILSGGKSADDQIVRQIKSISPHTDEAAFEQMAKAIVEWIIENPDPVNLGDVSYHR